MNPDSNDVAMDVSTNEKELMICCERLGAVFLERLALFHGKPLFAISNPTHGHSCIPAINAMGNIRKPTRPLNCEYGATMAVRWVPPKLPPKRRVADVKKLTVGLGGEDEDIGTELFCLLGLQTELSHVRKTIMNLWISVL